MDGEGQRLCLEPHGVLAHEKRGNGKAHRHGELQDDPTRHAQSVLPRLWSELDARRRATADKSYTKSLLDAGPSKIGAPANDAIAARW